MDWLVSDSGESERLPSSIDFPDTPYRLYRFLTDLEDILENIQDDRHRLIKIFPLVRRLLTSSEWIQMLAIAPEADLGWAVHTIYDEPDFPLTVQLVSWLPNACAPIHNHATWGIVAMLHGEEQNIFWQRTGDRKHKDKIHAVGEQILSAGEIIGFMPNAIHSVKAVGDQPTISFNLYGETNYQQRFEFDLATSTAQLF
jgi:predicted metal-dependent enzyme (double-stranded beta helix superfamily)